MKQQLNEIKRLQKIAGLLKEDVDIDLSDTPEFNSNPATKIKNLPIPTLDRIAATLSIVAKRGCYDITKETDLNTISNRDFSVYKYGAFACDLSDAARRIVLDLKIISNYDDLDTIDILFDRLEQEKLLYVEW